MISNWLPTETTRVEIGWGDSPFLKVGSFGQATLAPLKDQAGKPIADAEVDIWHSSPEGFYEQQDPKQAPMNLRGKFKTDARGHFSFRSVKPAGYPIPVDGPVGDLVRAVTIIVRRTCTF